MFDGDAQASQVAAEGPNKGKTLLIAGVVVRFPADLEPHKPQRTIMNQVIRSLQRTQNALIESPTGTGKSLALLCSSLAWLEAEKERARGNDEARNGTSESACMKIEEIRSGFKEDHHSSNFYVDDDDDDFTTRPAPRYRQPSINVTVQRSTGVFREPGSFSPAGERTICRLETSAAFDQASADDASKPTHTRIFFCSRTHGQLSQIVDEMRRTPYAGRMRATLLASREHYCIHADVQTLPKSMQTDACQRAIQQSLAEGGTAFARVAANALTDTPGQVSACYRHLYAPVRRTACLAPQPFQIEDIVQVGRRWHGCPYFAARFLVEGDVNPSTSSEPIESMGLVREGTPSADIVPPGEPATKSIRTASRLRAGIDPADIIFCPYSYLVDPIVRKRMGIDVTGAVVILDEAHNIEEACLEAASVDLTLSQVQRICQHLDEYLGSGEPEQCSILERSVSMGTRLSGEQLLRVWQHWLHAIVTWMKTLALELDDCTDAQATRRSSLSRRTGVQHLRGQAAVFWQDGAMLHEFETGLFGNWNFAHWEHSFSQLRGHVDRLRVKAQPTGHATASIQAADETRAGSCLSPSADSEQKPRAGIEIDPEYEPVASRHCMEVLHLLERFHVVLQFIYRGQYESEQRSNSDSALLYAADYRLVLRREASNESARSVEYRLGLWCMNPAVTFGYLREHARSIVLTSGTLSPMDSFRSELSTNFAYQAECDHIVDAAEQVQMCVVGSVPSGVQLEGSYRNSATWTYQDAVGEALHLCCAQVPDGVLCFLPSYRVLESMLQRWISTGAIERIPR
ncbi:hypothetical protein F1559_001113 [Cyanidiococcus yangmingshanensis]|uniref:Helicase ATP-binding domain-containing protein n=1 Tax=Cyanidiococcus yangmingshanensis TaxID=2690220 RepID=A0A7J7IEM5_9RHOD|nr:hypothetical protein F1559_001113 [Cyanidiococcus yangmingshanensis]